MSGVLDFLFRRKAPTASVAKERLQIVLAHERASRTAPEFLPLLQREVLAVVAKYLEVDDDMIKVSLQKSGDTSVLEINVEMDKARIRERAAAPVSTEAKPMEPKPAAKPRKPASTKSSGPKSANAGAAAAKRI